MAKADILRAYGTGNLTRDPESPAEGITKLRIASNSRVKQGDDWGDHTNYLDLTLFGKPAEWAMNDLVTIPEVTAESKIISRNSNLKI